MRIIYSHLFLVVPTRNLFAQKRATDYLHSYYDSTFIVQSEFEDWEIELH
ncbi:DUF7677 family protein [Maribacter ulvicola]